MQCLSQAKSTIHQVVSSSQSDEQSERHKQNTNIWQGSFRATNSPNFLVFGLSEDVRLPGENPQKQGRYVIDMIYIKINIKNKSMYKLLYKFIYFSLICFCFHLSFPFDFIYFLFVFLFTLFLHFFYSPLHILSSISPHT